MKDALLAAAEKGDTKSIYNLGLMYYYGEGVSKDYQKAFEQASRGLGWDDKESLANEINGLLGTFGVKAPKKDNGRIVWF